MPVPPTCQSEAFFDEHASRGVWAWLPDVAVCIAIAAGWCAWLAGPIRERMPVGDDTFRDAAYVQNILAGRLLEDPSMSGFSWWYAPGGPLLYAGISAVTGAHPVPLYSSSILWVNVLIPIGIFLLVRVYWDRGVALVALLMIWFGSRWWQTHMAMPIPSIQGVIPILVCLLLWRHVLLRGRWWTVALGVTLAVCTWHHMVCAVVVSAVIAIHAFLWAAAPGDGRYRPFRRAVLAGAVCAVLALPLAWHLLSIPWNNWAHSGLATEMNEPAFYLHSATPLLIPVAVIGVVIVALRPKDPRSWVLAYLVVGLVGQATGYLHRRFPELPIPTILPHEFQWHGQLAVGILAGVGLMAIARRVGRVSVRRMPRTVLTAATAAVLVVAVAAPDRARAIERVDEYWIDGRPPVDVQAALRWIESNTGITDVFVCDYLPAYYDLVGWTGRKLILMPEARANLAADVLQRRRDLYRLHTTQDPEEFRRIAVDRYGAGYVYVPREKDYLLERWADWDIFERADASPGGSRTILRIRAPSSGEGGV